MSRRVIVVPQRFICFIYIYCAHTPIHATETEVLYNIFYGVRIMRFGHVCRKKNVNTEVTLAHTDVCYINVCNNVVVNNTIFA